MKKSHLFILFVLFTTWFGVACGGSETENNETSACDGVDCSGHGECAVKGDGSAACLCDDGYESEGLECVAPDPCEGVTCSDHGTCAVADGEALCACDSGYEADSLECVAVDRCDGIDCSGHGSCMAEAGAASCDCDDGYVAEGLACIDPCDGVDCSGLGSCTVEANEAVCDCDDGYVAQGLTCIDPCDGVDCSGLGLCTVQGGEAACDCDDGYVAEGLACVDPCDGVDCSGRGTCEVQGNAAVCACERGFEAAGPECQKAFDWVLVGRFDVVNAPNPSSGEFEPLVGETVNFVIGIDVATIDKVDDVFQDGLVTTYFSDAVSVWIGGDNLPTTAETVLARVVADLDGRPHDVEIVVSQQDDTLSFGGVIGASSAEYYGFEILDFDVDPPHDNDGFAELEQFENKTVSIILRRYTNAGGFTMTDFLMNQGSLSLY